MNLINALTEEQATIMRRSLNENYPLGQSIEDIDLIADLTELKIKIRRMNELCVK
jgi:hypothetical protein